MSSSLEANKIAGAVLVAGLVALSSGIIADFLVEPHGSDRASVEVPAGEPATPTAPSAEPVGPIAPLMAAADPAAGEAIAKKCLTCHTFVQGGANKVGPNLWNVLGRPVAHMADFAYSDAMKNHGGTWGYEELNEFIANPKGYVPGTKMTFAGLGKIQDRANLIAYLRTLSASPQPLPEVTEAPATETGTTTEATTTEATTTEAATTETAAATTTEAAATATETAAATPAVDTAALMKAIAAADPAAGQNVAKKCLTCHTFEEGAANKVGPNLWDIVNRPVATQAGFNYSDAMKAVGGNWTLDRLDAYLADPKGIVPGTRMSFAGVRKEQDRIDLLAYLRTLSANPVPLE